jgi:hypothetical protein
MYFTCIAVHGSAGLGMGDNQPAAEEDNRGFVKTDGMIGRGFEGVKHNLGDVGVGSGGLEWVGDLIGRGHVGKIQLLVFFGLYVQCFSLRILLCV